MWLVERVGCIYVAEFRSHLLKDRREGRGVAGNSAEMYTQVCAHSISRFREAQSLMTLGR